MNEPDTKEMSQHLKQLVSTALKIKEEVIESNVQTVRCDDGSYICHLQVMIDGKEPTDFQKNAIFVALRHFGFPGIRVTSLKIPAEA